MNQTQKRFIVLPRHGFYLTTATAKNELQPIIERKKDAGKAYVFLLKTVRTVNNPALKGEACVSIESQS